MLILISAMLVGVWAAYSTALNISAGTVTFNTDDVKCNFYGFVRNNNDEVDQLGDDSKFSDIYNENDQSTDKQWKLNNISFRGAGDENSIVLRLAIQNYGENNVYVNKFIEPVRTSPNVEFYYRQAWGQKPNDLYWEADLDDMQSESYTNWYVDETETDDKSEIYLNGEDEYLRPFVELKNDDDVVTYTESWWYLLEIRIVLVNPHISVSGQSIDFVLEVTNKK